MNMKMGKQLPRGLRNNNPGNIERTSDKWVGMADQQMDPRFVTFKTMAYGYRALFIVINTYITKHGHTTVPGILGRYAPRIENDTSMYIASVLSQMNVEKKEDIDPFNEKHMKALARAITRVENGRSWFETDINDGWKMYLSRFNR